MKPVKEEMQVGGGVGNASEKNTFNEMNGNRIKRFGFTSIKRIGIEVTIRNMEHQKITTISVKKCLWHPYQVQVLGGKQ